MIRMSLAFGPKSIIATLKRLLEGKKDRIRVSR
jgi:hypothetical protein